jgi:4-amino-4-deoxy-L-arabinose transferase-like glycosyltransferase
MSAAAMDGRPRTLSAWCQSLWSDVLFPGPSPAAAESGRVRSLLLLIAVPALLLYPCLSFHLFEPDESRYAQIAREMLQRGEIVVPYLQGEPYLDKPPLTYWLTEASYALFGVQVGAARLAPALAVHATILLVYLLGRRSLGETSAFRGALVLSLAPGFLGMGRLLLLDGVLTLWTTLAVLSAFEAVRGPRLCWGWWLIAAIACGLGILTKGPIAVVLLLPPLWLYRWVSGRGCAPDRRGWAVFVGVVLTVALPWYIAMCLRVPAFAREFFWEHNVQRFLAPFAHQHGVWYYIPVLLGSLLPATLLIGPFLRFLFSSASEHTDRRPPELGFFLLAAGWCVLFFTLSACKLATYVLPAFPPLALAFGHFLTGERWRRSRCPAVAALSAFMVLMFVHYLALPWYAWFRSPLNQDEQVRRLCSDRAQVVVCYPRNCDSVSFYLGRDDLRNYRSKDIEDLRDLVRRYPRVVILCTHRSSLRGLRQLLPPEVAVVESVSLGLRDIPGVPKAIMKPLNLMMGETALGLCDIAVVEKRGPAASQQAGLAPR